MAFNREGMREGDTLDNELWKMNANVIIYNVIEAPLTRAFPGSLF